MCVCVYVKWRIEIHIYVNRRKFIYEGGEKGVVGSKKEGSFEFRDVTWNWLGHDPAFITVIDSQPCHRSPVHNHKLNTYFSLYFFSIKTNFFLFPQYF